MIDVRKKFERLSSISGHHARRPRLLGLPNINSAVVVYVKYGLYDIRFRFLGDHHIRPFAPDTSTGAAVRSAHTHTWRRRRLPVTTTTTHDPGENGNRESERERETSKSRKPKRIIKLNSKAYIDRTMGEDDRCTLLFSSA